MDIEAIVKKYYQEWPTVTEAFIQDQMRAALTELAAEHDRKQALLLEAHCERVSSLQERIRQLEAVQVPEGWIPVSERLPEPQTDVLIFASHHQRPHIAQVMVAGLFGPNKDARELEWMDNVSESMLPRRWWVTHWMPLPAAPKKEKGE
jgi:hypothetical protein